MMWEERFAYRCFSECLLEITAVSCRCSLKKMFLKISQNSQEDTCVRVTFLMTLSKKRLGHRCFPVNFAKFLRTPTFIEHLQWLVVSQGPCLLNVPAQIFILYFLSN